MASANDTNAVDPRIDDSLRATDAEIDEGYLHQLREELTLSVHDRSGDAEKQTISSGLSKEGNTIYVDFAPNDPRNPFNFSKRCVLTILNTCPYVLTFSIFQSKMGHDHQCLLLHRPVRRILFNI
jgi:hypothetical protein